MNTGDQSRGTAWSKYYRGEKRILSIPVFRLTSILISWRHIELLIQFWPNLCREILFKTYILISCASSTSQRRKDTIGFHVYETYTDPSERTEMSERSKADLKFEIEARRGSPWNSTRYLSHIQLSHLLLTGHFYDNYRVTVKVTGICIECRGRADATFVFQSWERSTEEVSSRATRGRKKNSAH